MNYSGTICKLNNPKGENFGRTVRVLLPVQPGETYGDGRVFSRIKDPTVTYYSFTPVDGLPMRGKKVNGEKFESMVLVTREDHFDIIEEAGEETQ